MASLKQIEQERTREDARSASVLLNCCQLASCGVCWSMPREPSMASFPHDFASEFPLATWMGDLVEREIGNDRTTKATLKRLVIPGSHDSASYSIPNSTPGSAVGKTQNLTIKEQLLSGVRFLDLRIASSWRDGVNIFHGRLMGCPFEQVLDEIRDFCLEFPKEFVILHVVAEFGRPFAAEDKVTALRLMKSRFGSPSGSIKERLICKVNTRSELINTPLQELIRENGRVCVLLESRIYDDFEVDGVEHNEDFVKNQYGFFDSSQWLRDKWHDTMDTQELLEGNLREIQIHKDYKRRHFVNNQFVLTPAFQCSNLFSYLSGRSSLQPVQLATQGLYQPPRGSKGRGIPLLHEMFIEHPEEDWNLLSLDFVDLAPSLMQLWVGMNFGPLEIEMALIGNNGGDDDISVGRSTAEDVTELVRSKILRGSCLFFHPLHEFDPEDLENSKSTLTIVYKVSGKLYSIVMSWSELASADVIIMNEHNHLAAGGTELTIGEGTQGNGSIAPPRHSSVTVTWQMTENKSFRFGYLDEDDTQKLVEGWIEQENQNA